jgi:hypothetical protein
MTAGNRATWKSDPQRINHSDECLETYSIKEDLRMRMLPVADASGSIYSFCAFNSMLSSVHPIAIDWLGLEPFARTDPTGQQSELTEKDLFP